MGRKWRRTWPCSVCHGNLTYDEATKTLECKCNVTHKRKPLPQHVLNECFKVVPQ